MCKLKFFLFVLFVWCACQHPVPQNKHSTDPDHAENTPSKIEESDPTALQFKANLQHVEQTIRQCQSMQQSIADIRRKLDAIPPAKKSDPKWGFQQVYETFSRLENEFLAASTELDSVRALNQQLIEAYKSGKLTGEDAMKAYNRVVVRLANISTTLEKSPDIFEDIRRFAERQ